MKKSKKVAKISLHRETVLHLQPEGLREQAGRVAGGNTGPSCEIFRACTLAGWDCGGTAELC